MSLKLVLDNWVLSRLAEPFDPEDVKWLPAFGSGNTGALAYVDARTVTNRLNEIVGADNWHDDYIESTIVHTEVRDVTDVDSLPDDRVNRTKYKTTPKFERDKSFLYNDIRYGGIRCHLTVLGVTKSDVGVPSFAEQLKGAYSDALKRAAVKFGIGEYFYRLGTLTAKVDYGKVTVPPELPDWALPAERPSPDPVIQEAITQVKTLSLSPELARRADETLRHIHVMGNYNSYAPLIVKRAVYEEVQRIIQEASSAE
jgi:hypothetical protein